MTDIAHKAQKVSPVHSTAAGLAAFTGGTVLQAGQAENSLTFPGMMYVCCALSGAAIAGGCHYVATAKRLVEEGIDPRQRVKAFPVAVSLGRQLDQLAPVVILY